MSELSATRKAALWVGVVFLLGAALGGMIGYGFAHRSVSAAPASQPEAVRRAQRVEQLTKELSLTSAQAQRLDAIIMQRHAESQALREQTDAQIEKVRQKAREEIRAILTPEQKPKFEDFLRDLDQKRKHGGPPPGR
jgi:Spy/CpxP family protein refolding chaperone